MRFESARAVGPRDDLVGKGLKSIETGNYMGIVIRLDGNQLIMDDGDVKYGLHKSAIQLYNIVEPREAVDVLGDEGRKK
jgi:hypothetical protein